MAFPIMSRKKATAMMNDVQQQYTKALNTANNQVERSNHEKAQISEQALYGGTGFYGSTAGQKYYGGISGSGSSLTIDHYSMRQNARRAVQESLEARAIVESFASNVVGKGLPIDPTPSWDLLGIGQDDPIRVEWTKNVSTRYELYSNDKKQHRSGTMSWYQFQRLYEFKQHRDNDMFTRFYYSSKRTLQNPLQFEGIDPNQIRGFGLTNSIWNNEHDYDDGIKHNSDGTESGYKIWIKKKNGTVKDIDIPRKSEKTGRIMMVHGYQPEYDGQSRGFARLGPELQELENLTSFTLAAINKAINQSQSVMSVENDLQTPGNPLEDNVGITAAGGTMLDSLGDSGVTGDTEAVEAITLSDRSTLPEVVARTEATNTQPGATAYVLNQRGDKVKMLGNGAQGDQFEPLVKNFYDRICAAAGTSSEIVLNIYKNNYTGIRAALVSVWRRYREWRQEIDTDLLAEHYEMWMSGEIAKGNINAPGWSDPVLKNAWLKHKVIGDPMPQSDPGREAKAIKEYLSMSLTTPEIEARNYNGTDYNDNIIKNDKSFENMPVPYWEDDPEAMEKQIEEDQKKEDGE